jgi:hypothetical protein
MSQYNALTLKVYSSGSTEVRNAGLEKAESVQFTQVYPGGKSAGMTFYIPRDVVAAWSVAVGLRIAVYNGMNMVWEGYITGIAPMVSGDRQGMNVVAEGVWSHVLQRRKTRKPWADTRVDARVWVAQDQAAHDQDMFSYDQNEGYVGISPRSGLFNSGDYTALRYTAPTGQTIKRITYNYDFDENVQSWEMQVYDPTGAAAIAASQITATGTGSHDLTLATPRQAMELRIYARGTINATLDKHVHAEWKALTVYTETGAINAQTIATKIASLAGGLSTDVSQIGAETVSLVPFAANGAESYADLLSKAAGYGDASFNKWAAWVDLSENASDSLPRLVLEQQPVLTAYDYAIRMDEPNVSGDLQFIQDLEPVRIWIAIQYQDGSSTPIWVTPDDDATLMDAGSISAYGQRDEWIQLNTTSQTAAKNYAKRFLAARKDLQWTTVGQLAVTGYIRSASGQRIPTSQIQAGKRVKVENWLSDLTSSGLTFLITGATYTDSDERCGLDIGLPNTLEVQLLRLQK